MEMEMEIETGTFIWVSFVYMVGYGNWNGCINLGILGSNLGTLRFGLNIKAQLPFFQRCIYSSRPQCR
jgi:uncharacterized membrane protein YjjP (DUF1212 family)